MDYQRPLGKRAKRNRYPVDFYRDHTARAVYKQVGNIAPTGHASRRRIDNCPVESTPTPANPQRVARVIFWNNFMSEPHLQRYFVV